MVAELSLLISRGFVNSAPSSPLRIWQIMGSLFLLIGAYLDNLRGPLLPIISKELGLDLSSLGNFLALGNLAAILGTFILIPILQKISERRAAMTVVLSLTLGWFAIRLSQLGYGTYALSFYFGFCTTLLGALSNIFIIRGTPILDQPKMLSGQQMMYGVGSMLAPLAVATCLGAKLPWTLLIVGLTPIALFMFFGLKWGIKEQGPTPEDGATKFKLDKRKMVVFLTFMGYVSSEVACSMWMTTYLNSKFELGIEHSSVITSAFFAVMMLTRLVCFFIANQKNQNFLMWFALIVPALIVSLVQWGASYYLLPLAGAFGTFFPIYFSKISQSFSKEWRSMAVWLIISLQIAVMIMNLGISRLAQKFGVVQTFWFIPITLCATMILFRHLLKTIDAGIPPQSNQVTNQ